MTAAVSDAVLVQQFRASRSEDAFAQIVSRHGVLVYRTCLRLLGNRSDAEDAAQAVFLVLARRCGDVKGPLVPWLLGVSRRVAHNLLVAGARRQRREKEAAREEPMIPAAANTTADLREELDAALAQLPPKLADAVVLRYLEGRSKEEAAEISGCPQGTLGWRAMEGLNRLRTILGRRGVVVAPALLMGYLAEQQALAVPATLAGKLTLAAMGKAAVSASAGALADAVGKAALVAKLKLAAAAVLAAGALGAGVVAYLAPPAAPQRMVFLDFDGPAPPVNKLGAGYPSSYLKVEEKDSGTFQVSLNRADAVAGHSLQLRLTAGCLHAAFNPYDRNRVRGFARDYAANPAGWRFNTYNRFRFWIKAPARATPHGTDGFANMQLGTSVKRVANADTANDDTGGGSFFHRFNVPATGSWTQVILNMHPHVRDGDAGSTDVGLQPHPTSEESYNYFDALTRFYLDGRSAPALHPADYLLDEMEFYRQDPPENDEQVYSIAATYLPQTQRIVLTWSRPASEDKVRHEVRYAFSSIHQIGWQRAVPASTIVPPGKGSQKANGMVFDSTDLPLAKQAVLYLAIKPENSDRFSQVAVPLTLK